MRKSRGVTTLETAIVIGMISTAIILANQSLGLTLTFSRPFEQVASVVGDSPPMASANSDMKSVTTTFRRESIPVLLLMSVLLVLGIALAYRWLHPSAESGAAKRSILKQLQKQLRNPPGLQCGKLIEKRERIFQAFTSNWEAVLNRSIQAGDVMSKSPTSVSPDLLKQRVVRLMKSSDLHHVTVCNEDGMLVGIISDRDLHKSGNETAADMMTADPITVQVNAEISEVISLMITNRISCVPVMYGIKLVGVISSSDIAITLQCTITLLNSLFSPAQERRLTEFVETR